MQPDSKPKFLQMVQNGGEIGKAYYDFYSISASKGALDEKTYQLVYLAYLAADGITEGIRRHTAEAKEAGASDDEIKSVILAGLPVSGAKLQDSYAAVTETLSLLQSE